MSGDKGYDILIGRELVNRAGELVRGVTKAGKAIVITDTNVAPLYCHTVLNSLKASGFEVFSHTFPAGEASKNLDTVNGMIEAMCAAQLTRGDIAVALGGGVVGDMAGFAAAIYLRGIDFVQIPTTLLSQVDSSVGGKTGCDLTFGKNLIGAFHNPRLVIIDTDTLSTLPDRYMKDGMGEVIKYGCIKSEKLFCKLETCEKTDDILEEIIFECVDIKRQVVENDFTEKGERMLLNFGHTMAHAIEKYYNFEGASHGEAVGIGMLSLTKASERTGETEKDTADRIEALLKKFSLPTTCNLPADKLVSIMLHDKKRSGNSINLVLLRGIGNSFIKSVKTIELPVYFTES